MEKLIKLKSGITMMALVVTVIVMVILAGTVSTLAIINVKEVKDRTYKADMAKIQKAFYDFFEVSLTNSEKQDTKEKVEEYRKRVLESRLGRGIPYNSITITGNGTTENYIKATKDILDIIDVKYDGDLVTYISLKDLKIVGTINRKYCI
jgi:hypothetical protein